MSQPGSAPPVAAASIARRRLGPSRCGTVVTADADATLAAYRRALDLQLVSDAPLSAAVAGAWGKPALAGRRLLVLGADAADPSTHWLRVLEVPGAVAPAPMRQRGWLALEVLVRDVVALGRRFDADAQGLFRVLGPPRPLSVSDDIWAMQVAGPAGETLYLTEVRAPVPPFALPMNASLTAERLFIPVLSAPDRDRSLSWYEALNGHTGLRFDSRVSALNRALGLDPEWRRPVATLQLAQDSLVEIDQVPEHGPTPAACAQAEGLPAGLAMVSLFADLDLPLPDGAVWRPCDDSRWPSCSVALVRGPAGECVELLGRPHTAP